MEANDVQGQSGIRHLFPAAGGDRGGNLLDDRGGPREGGTARGEDFSREVADLKELSQRAAEMEMKRKRVKALSEEIRNNHLAIYAISRDIERGRR